MDLQLAGQVAVVLGGAKGLGRAIARCLAQEQAAVAVLDIDPAGEAAAGELNADFGVPAQFARADVTDYAAVQQAAAQVAQRLGRPQHLVFCAAIGSGKFGFPFLNLEPADWPRVLEVNLLGAVHAAHAFAPALIEAGEGSMTFLSSVAGQMGSQTDPPYSASKAALLNFVQCAAKDLAPHHVRVNAICPGMVQTELNKSVWAAWARQQPPEAQTPFEDWAAEKIRRLVPMGRWQQPEEIAAVAAFLASRHACNITGQAINVDGGYVMH